MFSLNYRDARPIYEQVKDGLRHLVVTGAIQPGDQLPSVRALASSLAINPNTIQRAYNELEGEGYIYSVPGKGSFAAGNTDADAQRRAELLARLRVSLRRVRYDSEKVDEAASIYQNGGLKIDYAAGCTYQNGKEIHLTPIEYKLLCLLARHVGKVLTHTYIMQQIWGSSGASDIASLRVFMATLRKKIDSSVDGPQYIQTHIGVGYRMMKVE